MLKSTTSSKSWVCSSRRSTTTQTLWRTWDTANWWSWQIRIRTALTSRAFSSTSCTTSGLTSWSTMSLRSSSHPLSRYRIHVLSLWCVCNRKMKVNAVLWGWKILGSIKCIVGHKRKNRAIFLQLTRVWGMEERNRKLAHLPSKVLQRSLSIFTQTTCITYFHVSYE